MPVVLSLSVAVTWNFQTPMSMSVVGRTRVAVVAMLLAGACEAPDGDCTRSHEKVRLPPSTSVVGVICRLMSWVASTLAGPVMEIDGGTLGTLKVWMKVLRSPSLSSRRSWNVQSPRSASLVNAMLGSAVLAPDSVLEDDAGLWVMLQECFSAPPSGSLLWACRCTVAFQAGAGSWVMLAVGGLLNTSTM